MSGSGTLRSRMACASVAELVRRLSIWSRSSAAEVESVAELRSIIVSLGPFFIKLGQALSIRPDILSPRAMVELQQLCDKVPSFPSDLAFATICEELDVDSVGEVFSEITPEPVAAASLGQVYKATLRSTGDEDLVSLGAQLDALGHARCQRLHGLCGGDVQ